MSQGKLRPVINSELQSSVNIISVIPRVKFSFLLNKHQWHGLLLRVKTLYANLHNAPKVTARFKQELTDKAKWSESAFLIKQSQKAA